MLTSQFENLKINPDKAITKLNSKILKIANQAQALGEPICNEKLINMVLHALFQKFAMKKTIIVEMHDLKTSALDEHIGSLKQYEMEFSPDES